MLRGEGRYVFSDGLEYDQTDEGARWPYCTKHDRRYWSEYDKGVAPAGREQVAADPSKALPAGCYDCGDGYFDPKQGKVFAWGSDGSGEALRGARRPGARDGDVPQGQCLRARQRTTMFTSCIQLPI